ncbi:MAG: UDP-glucose/GDP-mannose dehydrogenase family protein [Acidiferrobacterales bacterium]
MKLTIIGAGYVGLVTGACFSEMGNDVICVDTDEAKIRKLVKGEIPIYEPGLDEMVIRNVQDGRLKFTTDIKEGIDFSNIYFIAVGTPPGEDGSADLHYVLDVAGQIGNHMDNYAVIVDKSTVPVGTADKVRNEIKSRLKKRDKNINFDVVSNPEFLKEGAAIDDFLKPDRIILGVESKKAAEVMSELYAPFTRNHERIIKMGIRDAEMTKYTANAMLATKISFMNEIANLCDLMGVDVEQVRLGIGSDSRIGYSFIYPGAGYGGSCFPKDVKALVHMAGSYKFNPVILSAVENRNNSQKTILAEKVKERFGKNLKGKTFAIWGLAFKPGTDDMREAPSIEIIKSLTDAGAKIQAFDPVARETALTEIKNEVKQHELVQLLDDQYSVLNNADALLLITEWKQFRRPDFLKMKKSLREAVIFDGRNQYEPETLQISGFEYYGIGRTFKYNS